MVIAPFQKVGFRAVYQGWEKEIKNRNPKKLCLDNQAHLYK